ncbi:MAG TPA: CPBP family intramembrane metalloprotease [Bacteroides sp.]|nr:CPBP family intramembrane metalloprotease [Bacteroides sp.]
MKKAVLILTFLAIAFRIFGQPADSIRGVEPERIPLWTMFLPGGSYFYQKQYVKGAVFSVLELGGLYLGMEYEQSLRENSNSPYYNYPLAIGTMAYQTEKLTHVRNQLEIMKYRRPDFMYDDISDRDLYLAPFKPENFLTPITGGMVLLAGVFLGIEKHLETHPISEVKQMYFLDRYISRNSALPVFSAASLAMSWGAGVSEEYIFRNWLMPVLDYRYGPGKGLVFSSLTFGVLHFFNAFASDEPDYGAALLQVGEATIAGYFLGRSVQRRNYNIGPAVAAHMWYDAVLMIGSFLINPEDNFLGVSIQLGIR